MTHTQRNIVQHAVKPGWKTTEFWISLLAILLPHLSAGGALAAFASTEPDLQQSPWWIPVVIAVGNAFVAVGYAIARALQKRKELEYAPLSTTVQ